MLGSLAEAMRDPLLFGPAFQPAESWAMWRTVAKAVFGEPLEPAEAEGFARLAGGRPAPTAPVREVLALVGRRGGKSRFAAALAVWLAVTFDPAGRLAPGERGVVFVVATTKAQARVCFSYLRGLLEQTPMLAPLVEATTAETISLTTGVDLEVVAADYRSVRGRTLIACLIDEVCFLPADPEAASPDTALIAAVKPALATTRGMVIAISSPHLRAGWAWETYRQSFGQPDPHRLVIQAASRAVNPTLDPEEIERAYQEDPAVAAAEWGGEWRTDLERFLPAEVVDRAIEPRGDLPPVSETRYVGFVDPSGGSYDRFALAIGHAEGDRLVVDAVRHRQPPFSPEAVVAEFAALLKTYGVTEVTGDRYAGQWPREAFRKVGIAYVPAAAPKHQLYLDVLPRFMAGQVRLPDDRVLRTELLGLERRARSGGRDTVDHAPGARDDVANAVAGVVVRLGEADGHEPVRLWFGGAGPVWPRGGEYGLDADGTIRLRG